MFKITYLIICLIILSYRDIKYRNVPVIWLVFMGAAIPVMYAGDYFLCGLRTDGIRITISVIVAALFVFISVFTSLIGEADGIIIGYVCMLTDVYEAVMAVFISFVVLAAAGVLLMLLKKLDIKKTIPYVPYLFLSCLFTLLIT